MFSKFRGLLQNPKVQKVVIGAASYYAGAHGGPLASAWVQDHGPQVIAVLVAILGG